MRNRISLLVAEDEPIIRLAMQDALEGGGYDVVGASSGDAAMALLQEAGCTFSGLITDTKLRDGRDGWALACCARERIADLCVLYVTGDSAADWAAKGVPKSLVLQKPVADARYTRMVSPRVFPAQ